MTPLKELILRPKPAPLTDFNFAETPSRIVACPNPPIEAVEMGHAIAISEHSFSVQSILKQLPFQPDLVHLSARVMDFLPRGLHRLNCPTVMKLGDTFHLGDGGLSGMIRYCKQLNCDYHWTYQSKQHLRFFAESRLKNIFWLPGSIVIDPHIPAPSKKEYDVIFRGSKSDLHQYRTHILNGLKAAGIQVDISQKSYLDSLEDYAKSRIVINTSLNGDLNRRVFEVLMAGGFLLTDRIRPQSGLFELFEEGTHFECYGNEVELIEKIKFYLTHPQKAEKIAAAGHQHFLTYYSQKSIQHQLYRTIFNSTEFLTFQPSNYLTARIKLYELIQELHRIYPSLKIRCPDPAIVSDLPRIQLAETEVDILVIDGNQDLEESVQHLRDRGFLFLTQPFNPLAILKINQGLNTQFCFPVELSTQLFNQQYNLSLEPHGLIYQKILPKAYSELQPNPANLAITQIDLAKMIQSYTRRLLQSYFR